MNDLHNSAQRARLFPWIIVRLLPNLQRITVGRFRHRSDAEGHLRILRQMMPMAEFAIAFDLIRPLQKLPSLAGRMPTPQELLERSIGEY